MFIRVLRRMFRRGTPDEQYEIPMSEEEEAACLEYDLWKNAYRDAFAEYEEACKRKDWVEADRWFKRYAALFEPRRRDWHGVFTIPH